MNIDVIGELILGGSLKGAVVALIGVLIAWKWRHRAAVDRHTLSVLVLMSFLVLPLIQKVGPRWGVLPSVASAEPTEAPILNATVERNVPATAEVLTLPTVDPRAVSVPNTASESSGIPAWAVIWLAGVLLMLGKIIVGRSVLWSLGRQVENGRIQVRVRELRDQLGIRRSVDVVMTARRRMPMTWGWQHPKILLPEEASDWEKDRLDAVLLHELAHVQRHDALTQCLSQLVISIYWFHPLVWMAAWRLAAEREQACDQVVIDEGVKPSEYARQLMAVALGDGASGSCVSAGMGMARKGPLEQRLRTLLEGSSKRSRFSVRWLLMVALAWLGIVGPLATVNSQEEQQEEVSGAPPTLEQDLQARDVPSQAQDVPSAGSGKNEDMGLSLTTLEIGIAGQDRSRSDAGETMSDEKDSVSVRKSEMLRERYIEERRALEMLEAKYGPKHPKMIAQQQALEFLAKSVAELEKPSPIGDREELRRRYDQEIEELNQMGLKYLGRHPRVIKQKALVGEIAKQLGDAENVVRVAAAVSGIVSEVHVFRKQEVKKGSVMLEIDSRRARVALKAAEAQWELAKSQLNLGTRAFEAGDASTAEMKEMRSDVQLAETALAVAKIDLDDLTVRAPADGVVVSVDAKVGEYVSPEKPVVHLRAKLP